MATTTAPHIKRTDPTRSKAAKLKTIQLRQARKFKNEGRA